MDTGDVNAAVSSMEQRFDKRSIASG